MRETKVATYTPRQLKAINESLAGQPAEEILRWSAEAFAPDIKLASSFGAEDVVLIDMICKVTPQVAIFTLDTGRLNDETYEVMERIRHRYGIEIEAYFPDREAVERLVREKGFYCFRESVENRRECCRIHKVEPLRRALAGMRAWITADIQIVEWDEGNGGVIKVNPLAEWTQQQVWDYIRTYNVPYNRLHDQGYPSIGCAPCTRAIKPGEDIRAGRWWWELPEQKECGLHR